MRRYLSSMPLWFLLFLIAACDKETKTRPIVERNHAPEILEVNLNPERVLAWQEISANCRVRDDDGDFLVYDWQATAGAFPLGRRAATVLYRTPASWNPVTLSVEVTDLADTARTSIEITFDRVAPPTDLDFVNGATVVDLTWRASPDEAVLGWSGYEIYVAPHSLAGAPPESLAPYRLTASPIDRLQQRVGGVPPGERRFYALRSRRDFQGVRELSPTGPEIETSARPDGIALDLYEVASRLADRGVHLPGASYVDLSPGNRESVDFYLGTGDPEDDRSAELYLKSPSLLAYRDPAWGDRVTGFQDLGTDPAVAIAPESGYVEQVAVLRQHVYAVRTADGHYAKIQVTEIRGARPERRIGFTWAWQPLEGYPRF